MKTENKKSPLASQAKRRMNFDDGKARLRAITEEVDGQTVRRLRGYAILFGVFGKPYRGSDWVEKIEKSALEGVDLSKIVLLWDHNTSWVLGRSGKNVKLSIDDTGLFVEATLGNTWVDDYVFDRVQRDIVDGMSFYFDSKAIIASDWQTKIDVVVKINEIYEVSLLAFPAYEETVMIAETIEEDTSNPPADPPADPAVEEDEALKEALKNIIDQL